MPIDLLAAFENQPPALDFIWPGFLAGTVGALVAPGATGKSFWALEATMSVACSVAGGDLLGLDLKKTGPVIYLAGDDPQSALVSRAHAIGHHLEPAARESVAANLVLEPIMGKRLNVMDDGGLHWIIERCMGARLIVVDTLSRIHTLDENSNGNMAHLLTTLEYIADTTGASLLYLHHISKFSARDGQAEQQQAARGASALIDNARWCGYLARMTEDESKRLSDSPQDLRPIGSDRRDHFVKFGVSKQNYDVRSKVNWFERQEGGVLCQRKLFEIDKKGGKGRTPRKPTDGF